MTKKIEKVVKKVKITLCRSMHWTKDIGNFYNIWERYGGTWTDIEKIKEDVELKMDERKETYVKHDSRTSTNVTKSNISSDVSEIKDLNNTDNIVNNVNNVNNVNTTTNIEESAKKIVETKPEYKLRPLPI